MSADRKQKRYDEILSRIADRRPFGSDAREDKAQRLHDQALNLVNAYDALAELAQHSYATILCYGPKALGGPAWSGVVVWYHRRGYHGYQNLNLLGAWAHYHESEINLTIGIRQLPYRAPVYDPGAYRVAIQNNFRIYYEDDGQPPDASDRLLYRAPFELQKRLAHRQALAETLQQWKENTGPS